MKVQPGTIAAIAASLIAQGENLGENSEFFSEHWRHIRKQRIKEFVQLSVEICQESEILFNQHSR